MIRGLHVFILCLKYLLQMGIGDSPYGSLQSHCNSFNASLPTPIGKPRSQSCSSVSVYEASAQLHNLRYQKAPGSEREDREVRFR